MDRYLCAANVCRGIIIKTLTSTYNIGHLTFRSVNNDLDIGIYNASAGISSYDGIYIGRTTHFYC